MNLDECDRLMKGRDLGLYAHPEDKQRTLLALADEVPGLVAEVRALSQKLDSALIDGRAQEFRRWEEAFAKLNYHDLQVGISPAENLKLFAFWWDHADVQRLQEQLRVALLQNESLKKGQYVAAVEYLKAEAQKIPLGAGDQSKGFSSTYNALMFCARALEENCIEKRVDPAPAPRPRPRCYGEES